MPSRRKNRAPPGGRIAVCFTPDEEIGRGAGYVDLDKLGADFGYTVDGGPLGCLEYENFNAASAEIIVRGNTLFGFAGFFFIALS